MYCMCKMTIMDERELIRYIAGEGTPEERAKVLDWVEESQEHRKRFNGLKNAWVMAHLPQGRASRRNVPWREERRSGGWRSMWVGYGVAASLVLLLAFGLWEREKQHEADIAFLEGQEMARMVYRTDKGVKGKVTLPDGSTVWLNSDSELECPSRFSGDTREIVFSGEGFFDVVKNAERPMVIRLENGLRVVVRGTTFNLASYRDDDYVTALLVEGNITVQREQDGKREEVRVRPNERVRILKREEQSATVNVPAVTFPILGWKEGWLVFDETPMDEVVKKLERWHGIHLEVGDEELLKRRFTARFHEESIQQILEMMEQVALLRYRWAGDTAHLYMY